VTLAVEIAGWGLASVFTAGVGVGAAIVAYVNARWWRDIKERLTPPAASDPKQLPGESDRDYERRMGDGLNAAFHRRRDPRQWQ
jgi:hypothetical protein